MGIDELGAGMRRIETLAMAVGACLQLTTEGYTGSIAVSGKSPFYTGACSAARSRSSWEPGFTASLLEARHSLHASCSGRQLRSCGLPGELRGQQRAEWLCMQSRPRGTRPEGSGRMQEVKRIMSKG